MIIVSVKELYIFIKIDNTWLFMFIFAFLSYLQIPRLTHMCLVFAKYFNILNSKFYNNNFLHK